MSTDRTTAHIERAREALDQLEAADRRRTAGRFTPKARADLLAAAKALESAGCQLRRAWAKG